MIKEWTYSTELYNFTYLLKPSPKSLDIWAICYGSNKKYRQIHLWTHRICKHIRALRPIDIGSDKHGTHGSTTSQPYFHAGLQLLCMCACEIQI